MKSGEKGTKEGQSSDPIKPSVGPLFKVTQNKNNPGSVESGLELESQVVSTSL